jgi:hypothetical protein
MQGLKRKDFSGIIVGILLGMAVVYAMVSVEPGTQI